VSTSRRRRRSISSPSSPWLNTESTPSRTTRTDAIRSPSSSQILLGSTRSPGQPGASGPVPGGSREHDAILAPALGFIVGLGGGLDQAVGVDAVLGETGDTH